MNKISNLLLLKIFIVFFLVFCALAGCSDVKYTPPEGSTEIAITHYSFGKMVIDKKEYTGDLAILPGGKITSFSFDYGSHSISPNDFKDLITDNVKVVIFGTGYEGLAYLSAKGKEMVEQMRAKGIKVEVMPSSDAVRLFNASSKKGLLVCFHLNC